MYVCMVHLNYTESSDQRRLWYSPCRVVTMRHFDSGQGVRMRSLFTCLASALIRLSLGRVAVAAPRSAEKTHNSPGAQPNRDFSLFNHL
jgi:hypothetical protein